MKYIRLQRTITRRHSEGGPIRAPGHIGDGGVVDVLDHREGVVAFRVIEKDGRDRGYGKNHAVPVRG